MGRWVGAARCLETVLVEGSPEVELVRCRSVPRAQDVLSLGPVALREEGVSRVEAASIMASWGPSLGPAPPALWRQVRAGRVDPHALEAYFPWPRPVAAYGPGGRTGGVQPVLSTLAVAPSRFHMLPKPVIRRLLGEGSSVDPTRPLPLVLFLPDVQVLRQLRELVAAVWAARPSIPPGPAWTRFIRSLQRSILMVPPAPGCPLGQAPQTLECLGRLTRLYWEQGQRPGEEPLSIGTSVSRTREDVVSLLRSHPSDPEVFPLVRAGTHAAIVGWQPWAPLSPGGVTAFWPRDAVSRFGPPTTLPEGRGPPVSPPDAGEGGAACVLAQRSRGAHAPRSDPATPARGDQSPWL